MDERNMVWVSTSTSCDHVSANQETTEHKSATPSLCPDLPTTDSNLFLALQIKVDKEI
jgi:hypothetical protein